MWQHLALHGDIRRHLATLGDALATLGAARRHFGDTWRHLALRGDTLATLGDTSRRAATLGDTSATRLGVGVSAGHRPTRYNETPCSLHRLHRPVGESERWVYVQLLMSAFKYS